MGKSKRKFRESDYVGAEYGFWKIVRFRETQRLVGGQIVRPCLCRCRCGIEKDVLLSNLLQGFSRSCGCRPYDNHNIYFRSRIYAIYNGMIQRCYNAKSSAYKYYGGRGINVCERWRDDFYAFAKDMGDPPDGYSIDRADVNGNYEPSNCRWATRKEQAGNKRNSHLLTAANLAKRTGYTRERIRQLSGMVQGRNYKNILKPYIDYTETVVKNTTNIYKPEAVKFLIEYKNRPKLAPDKYSHSETFIGKDRVPAYIKQTPEEKREKSIHTISRQLGRIISKYEESFFEEAMKRLGYIKLEID